MRSKTRNKRSIRTMLKDKRGISPVITTVILVAVGIALAVAIGLWMSGLVSTFTRFEKLEVSAYAIPNSNGTWTVYVTANNTGAADATITYVLINNIPNSNWNGNATVKPSPPVTINVGSGKTFIITLTKGKTIGSTTLSPGITINIVLHSAAGKDYPYSVPLS
ncbi:MAG: archaellin/type IV pilin N-terminal domain-containing protein [Thermoproteota archaeon]